MNDLNPLPGYKLTTSLVTHKQIQWEKFIVRFTISLKLLAIKSFNNHVNLKSVCYLMKNYTKYNLVS